MEWAQIISSLGFPIACCIALAIYVSKITEQNREDTKEMNKEHTKEMLEFKEDIKEALNNNTMALNKLCEKLEKVGVKNE